ncbi:YceI family protein [Dyadobacter sp. CY261]|uniref:YceI family protein n=1 Tax=Dyadobacter sp. CY261 TaxID=2907203 RepID=UPI001F1792E4|nr:YceI family protein [Dyadobacter sp. CY261]MCF0075291.1 YceI family protein [Dyadobacter sp. CY261]
MKQTYLILVLIMSGFPLIAQTNSVMSGQTEFEVKAIYGTVKGSFEPPSGKVIFDLSAPTKSEIDISIAASSFSTGKARRDQKMLEGNFFHSELFSRIQFKSSIIQPLDDYYLATGMLTIKEVSKMVALPFKVNKNPDGSLALSSTFKVSRLAYGIGRPSFMLKDMITVSMNAVIK